MASPHVGDLLLTSANSSLIIGSSAVESKMYSVVYIIRNINNIDYFLIIVANVQNSSRKNSYQNCRKNITKQKNVAHTHTFSFALGDREVYVCKYERGIDKIMAFMTSKNKITNSKDRMRECQSSF